jgi:tetratricopeptide (TPR) repeat protein
MAPEEIERLKDKIEKDPYSKLFVPLAEEYKKANMYDEAIDVLAKGLEKQPGYLSARVSLGKIYIERGMLDKACSEFEKVIEAIPDNLYAHKKLAEIYKDIGEKDNAVKEFKTVLRLNPADEWAATSLAEIEGKPEKPLPEPAEGIIAEPRQVEEKIEEEVGEKEIRPVEVPAGEEEIDITELRSEIAETVETEGTPEVIAGEQEAEILEQQPQAFKDLEEEPAAASISEEDMKLWKAHAEEETAEEETVTEPGELPEEESFSFESVFRKPQASVEEAEEIPEEVSEQPPITVADADRYISQEKYSEAMNVYRNLLSAEPDNKQILQRVEELRALLKMLGKDKEQLISRLDSFLSGVRKRRNEFFGSP